ncbi:hypothetical protein LguiB_023960 [Lonicera macranthoides]
MEYRVGLVEIGESTCNVGDLENRLFIEQEGSCQILLEGWANKLAAHMGAPCTRIDA